MARENQVLLNGQIVKMRKTKREDEIVQITIGLYVMRRPLTKMGNRSAETKCDTVLVVVRDKEQIRYLENQNAAKGDMLEVSGVYCTLNGMKKFFCKECNGENSYVGTMTFVHPKCLRLSEIHPKRYEVVTLSELERHYSKEEINQLLNSRKTFTGEIIGIEDLGADEDGTVKVRLTVREKVKDSDVLRWLRWMGEISNRIYVIGNVCADPVYNPIDNGGRVCTYQIGVNRKLYIKEDSPDDRADFPWVKSLGDQADKDYQAIHEGSLVWIDGSIQAREGFVIEKTCEHCGATCHIKGSAMEIVPHYVEYLANCEHIADDEEEDEELFLEDGEEQKENTANSIPSEQE